MTAEALAVLAAGAIVLAVAAELAARAWLARYGRYYVWPPFSRLHMTTDREAVPELEPLVRVEINEDGERGGPVPRDPKQAYRVLVAGGSVAECWFIDQESTWPQVIDRTLNEPANLAKLRAKEAHVGNIGRSLVACEHIETMLARVLPRYERLDVLILMVGASDLVHWLERGAPRVIDRDDVPISALFGENPAGPFGWTPKTLALRRIASRWRRHFQRRVVRRDGSGQSIAAARKARARATEILHEVYDPAPMLDRFDRHFRRLIVRARAKSPRVILARQPWLEREFTEEEKKKHLWMFGVGRIHSEEVSAYYAHDLVWKLMRKVDERASKVATEMGIEQIDLRPVVPPTFELWYDEMHHNARGCERIGRAIAALIVDGA